MSGDELGRFAVAIYAASVDPPDTNAAFAKQLELGYPILSDPGKDVARAFGVLAAGKEYASRTTFIIGKDGTILEIMRDVNPTTHGKDVAARLAALGIPRRSPADGAASGSAASSASSAPASASASAAGSASASARPH